MVIPFPVGVPLPTGTPTDREKLDDARAELRALQEAVADLERRVEKQAVLLRALFAVLSARQGLSEAELLDCFRSIEADRAGASARKCSLCGRAVNKRTHRCFYCGEACEVESAFEFLELGAWPSLPVQPNPPPPRPSGEHGITTRPRM
jgi:hypothetical protein